MTIFDRAKLPVFILAVLLMAGTLSPARAAVVQTVSHEQTCQKTNAFVPIASNASADSVAGCSISLALFDSSLGALQSVAIGVHQSYTVQIAKIVSTFVPDQFTWRPTYATEITYSGQPFASPVEVESVSGGAQWQNGTVNCCGVQVIASIDYPVQIRNVFYPGLPGFVGSDTFVIDSLGRFTFESAGFDGQSSLLSTMIYNARAFVEYTYLEQDPVDPDPNPVPEPAPVLLLATACFAIALRRRKATPDHRLMAAAAVGAKQQAVP